MIWYGMWSKDAVLANEPLFEQFLKRGPITVYEHEVRFQKPERKRKAMDPEIDDIISMVSIVNNSWFNYFTFFLIAMIPVIPLAFTKFGRLLAAAYAGIIEGLLALFFTLSGNAFFVAMLQGMAEEAAQHVFFSRPLFTLFWVGIEWAQLVDGMNTILLNKTWPPEHLERMWIERGQKVGAAGYAPPIDLSRYFQAINEFRESGAFVKISDFLRLHPNHARILRDPCGFVHALWRALVNSVGFEVAWLGPFDVFTIAPPRIGGPFSSLWLPGEKVPPFLRLLEIAVYDYTTRDKSQKYIGFEIVWPYLVVSAPEVYNANSISTAPSTYGAVAAEGIAGISRIKYISRFLAPYAFMKIWSEKHFTKICDNGEIVHYDRDKVASAGRVEIDVPNAKELPVSGVVHIKTNGRAVIDRMRSGGCGDSDVVLVPGWNIVAIAEKFLSTAGVQVRIQNATELEVRCDDGVETSNAREFIQLPEKLPESEDESNDKDDEDEDTIKVRVSFVNNKAFAFSYGFLANYATGGAWWVKSVPEYVDQYVASVGNAAKEACTDLIIKMAGLVMVTLMLPILALTGARIFYEHPFWARWVIGEETLEKAGLAVKVFAPTLADFLSWTTIYYPGLLRYLVVTKTAPVIPGPTAPFALASGAPLEMYVVRDPFRAIRGLTLADVMTYWMLDIADIAGALGRNRGFGIAAPSWAENYVGEFLEEYLPPALPGVAGGGIVVYHNLRKLIDAVEAAWDDLEKKIFDEAPRKLYLYKVAPIEPPVIGPATEVVSDGRRVTFHSIIKANMASLLLTMFKIVAYAYMETRDKIECLLGRFRTFLDEFPVRLRPLTLYSAIAACTDQPVEAFWHMRAQAFARTLELETKYLQAWSRGETLD